ncbi:helicase associated domain-containing protein [Streptomyces sp. NBC_01435]|uniref:helicase associated domain-containing protein n=1 Tax=Streptomyces sp. NBC_01435 TaxID=2903865 RepID=UPI002E334DA2|nr:helicase associated domain-containing protein [Streptomyces sp. NBC_01435]
MKQTQNAKWAVNLAAAQAFFAREGHLRVPRKHSEHLGTEEGLESRQDGTDGGLMTKLGT